MLRRLGIQISNRSTDQFGPEYLASRSIGGGTNSFGRSSDSRDNRRWGRRQVPNFSINGDTIENSDYKIPEKPVVPEETYVSWETHARYGYAR
jgi:hypothetical protein